MVLANNIINTALCQITSKYLCISLFYWARLTVFPPIYLYCMWNAQWCAGSWDHFFSTQACDKHPLAVCQALGWSLCLLLFALYLTSFIKHLCLCACDPLSVFPLPAGSCVNDQCSDLQRTHWYGYTVCTEGLNSQTPTLKLTHIYYIERCFSLWGS